MTDVGGDGALRCRLLDMGLIPKTKVMVRKVAPMGDPIELFLRGYELTIRLEDAEKITITDIKESEKV
ncbi:MAG: ferrous iron transport protein A [Oscillospiraceae bacterium]|nr:ferrous iron transport protein A [Oscillospiraceae bacterium]